MQTNQTISPEKKLMLIKDEKRRRLQIYTKIDYFCNTLTFMDFYSIDLRKILVNSRVWVNLINELKDYDENIQIDSDDLLCSFILTDSSITHLLNKYHINQKFVKKALEFYSKRNVSANIFSRLKSLGKDNKRSLRIQKKRILESHKIPNFSEDSISIIENSIQNALNRFKTPVITPEIFFITLMEAKSSKAGKIIKKIVPKELDWYTLRYKLIKNIHFQESHMRNDIAISQRNFGYLLKANLTQLEFSRLVELELLGLAVEYFRNQLFKSVLHENLLEEIKNDIYYSASIHKREYSL